MINNQHETQSFSMGEFVWWTGVVEDRMDPLKLGRVRVRIVGYHTDDRALIPTDKLPWAVPLQDIVSAAMNGIGMSPTGLVEGTWVMGFFRDGHNAQDPIVIGSLGGIPASKQSQKGFSDPSGKYPLTDFINEADTNRLSRNEKIEDTVVQTKKDGVELGVEKALGKGTWDEPETQYKAEYPFNHVRETENGLIEEFDDTAGSERYHRYHPTGTFTETYPDGREVRKIVNDKYELIAGDDYIQVKGDVNVTVDGDANILVKGNSNLETKGNREEYVQGNYTLDVGGTTRITSKGRMYLKAPRIDLN
jgi:hypothetical protein